jgi:hypothetical protein
MSTVAEIQKALPQLTNEELHKVEEAVHQLYRNRNAGIIYDDTYGVWTEDDQASAAAEAFTLMEQAEKRDEQSKTR